MAREFDLTVTGKGQVTLPAAFRKAARITDGSKLRLTLEDNGEVRLRRRLTLEDIAGSLTAKIPAEYRNFTKADIETAVADAMSEKWERVAKQARQRKPKGRAA